MKLSHSSANRSITLKFVIIIIIIITIISLLVYRLIYIDGTGNEKIIKKANGQLYHSHIISENRGILFDRNNTPLAVSTTLYNIILDVKVFLKNQKNLYKLHELNISRLPLKKLLSIIEKYPNSRYQILVKYLTPNEIEKVNLAHIPGIHIEKMFRTFYPQGEASAALVGYTNSLNNGQAGLELTFDNALKSIDGTSIVATDPKNNIITEKRIIKKPKTGKNITLSIDHVIQHFAYDALKTGVIKANAKSGAAVVLNPKSGEVLAAVSYPSFNPNVFSERKGENLAERPIIQTFEPGSSIKPFIVAIALQSKKYTPNTIIDTNPGHYLLKGHKIRDDSNFGVINVTQVLQKSSNVGISKIALSLPHEEVFEFLRSLDFGSGESYFFPRENSGFLPIASKLGDFSYATTAFGYGMTSSVLQLAHAYSIFANHGKLCPITFTKIDNPNCKRIISQENAKAIKKMLHSVVTIHGTGLLANIPGYDVGGKTGTVHRVGSHGYLKHSFNSYFAGIAPLDNPRLVIIIWIEDPQKNHFYQYGGVSAAPIFASIARKSLSYLRVPYHEDLSNFLLKNKSTKWLLHIIENN